MIVDYNELVARQDKTSSSYVYLQSLEGTRTLKSEWLDKADSSQVELYMSDKKHRSLPDEKLYGRIPSQTCTASHTSVIFALSPPLDLILHHE
jgi:hypothetical protein